MPPYHLKLEPRFVPPRKSPAKDHTFLRTAGLKLRWKSADHYGQESLFSLKKNFLDGSEMAIALSEMAVSEPDVRLEHASSWFALVIRPRHEKTAAACLHAKGLEAFLPLHRARRQWTDRVQEVELPLFPGYLFCRFGPERYVPVMQTPGVTAVVGFGGRAAPVDPAELAAIRTALQAGCRVEEWPYLETGARVLVKTGPLAGIEGILLREKSKCRVVVSVKLLQRSVAIELGRGSVSSIRVM